MNKSVLSDNFGGLMKGSFLLRSILVSQAFTLVVYAEQKENIQVCNGRKTIEVKVDCDKKRKQGGPSEDVLACSAKFPDKSVVKADEALTQAQYSRVSYNMGTAPRFRAYNDKQTAQSYSIFLDKLTRTPESFEFCKEYNQCEMFLEGDAELAPLAKAIANDGIIDGGDEVRQIQTDYSERESKFHTPADRPRLRSATYSRFNFSRSGEINDITLSKVFVPDSVRDAFDQSQGPYWSAVWDQREKEGSGRRPQITESDLQTEKRQLQIRRSGDSGEQTVTITDPKKTYDIELRFKNGKCYPWKKKVPADGERRLASESTWYSNSATGDAWDKPFDLSECESLPSRCSKNRYWRAYISNTTSSEPAQESKKPARGTSSSR